MALGAIPDLDLSSLKGKSVIITGGASGLGLATTKAFASAGAYITIADVNPPREDLSCHLNASYVHCDTTSWSSQLAAFKHAIEFAPSKSLDVACLFAGVASDGGNLVDHILAAPVDSDPPQPGTLAIDVNLKGVYWSAWLALHHMRQNKSSGTRSLVFVSSMAGYLDHAPHTMYSGAKFGVRGIFRGVRSRAHELGVRVNLLAPSYIDTPMTKGIRDVMEAKNIQEGQEVRFGRIDDVVKAVGIFATDEKVDGRAYAVIPQDGIVDLRDDIVGIFAGEVLVTLLKKSAASARANAPRITG